MIHSPEVTCELGSVSGVFCSVRVKWSIFLRLTEGKYYNYAENIRRHGTEFSSPGKQAPGFLHPCVAVTML